MATVSGGDKLRARLAEISAMASSPATLRVGFLEGGGTYPDGTSVAMIAVINEYGKFAQPPRPYFRNMIAAKSPEWPAAIAGLSLPTPKTITPCPSGRLGNCARTISGTGAATTPIHFSAPVCFGAVDLILD